MQIEYGYDITVAVSQPTPIHALLDVHPERLGDIVFERPFSVTPAASVVAETDAFGNRLRRFVLWPGESNLSLRGIIRDSGELDRCAPGAREYAVPELPASTLQFLQGSRYCETDKLSDLAWNLFGGLAPGYGRVAAICDFVHRWIGFNYADARPTRTALEAYQERKGVCRDYAHLAIAFCRALNVPARYVNGYLGDIGVPPHPAPMDFSAWFEAYLEGGWYTFDARHNQRRIGRVVIARGRDAADVPMIHSFGEHQLRHFHVVTREVNARFTEQETSAAA
jgi:transglutaminase-like putative cysteine protease